MAPTQLLRPAFNLTDRQTGDPVGKLGNAGHPLAPDFSKHPAGIHRVAPYEHVLAQDVIKIGMIKIIAAHLNTARGLNAGSVTVNANHGGDKKCLIQFVRAQGSNAMFQDKAVERVSRGLAEVAMRATVKMLKAIGIEDLVQSRQSPDC